MNFYHLRSTHFSASIDPFGAQLRSFKDETRDQEYLWQADPTFWPKCAPILFPIVGRLRQGAFLHQGQRYILSKHGFARDNAFECIEHTKQLLTLRLTSTADMLQAYPFPFVLDVRFILEQTGLTVQYIVRNSGEETMWFSLGSHPALDLPLAQQPEGLADYWLAFNQEESLQRYPLQDGLLSPAAEAVSLQQQRLWLSAQLFDRDALIFKQLNSDVLTLGHRDQGEIIHFETGGAPHLGIWSKPKAPFVCLEPWYGYDDAVEPDPTSPAPLQEIAQKEGIQSLAAGEVFQTYYALRPAS